MVEHGTITVANDKWPEPTYICKDCGYKVYDALGEVRERCLTCTWIAAIENDQDREDIREWLRKLD
jgi:hypothetical protein